MLIRNIKTGEIQEIELSEWWVEYATEWEKVPDDPTAGVAAVVPENDGPPPLEAARTHP